MPWARTTAVERLGSDVWGGSGSRVSPDRGIQLVTRGGDQAGVIGFEHAAALALASAVDTHPVEQVARAAGLVVSVPADGRDDPYQDVCRR